MDCKLTYTERGDPDLPSLILLHGFLGSKDDWTEVMDRIEGHYHCIAVDLPGHGGSLIDGDTFAYTMNGAACELISLMLNLKVDSAGLLGYSMGGRLAYHLLCRHGEYFNRAFIESSTPGILGAKLRLERFIQDQEMASKLLEMDFEGFLKVWYEQDVFESLLCKAVEKEKMLERRRENSPQHLAQSMKGMSVGNQRSYWDDLKTLDIPITLITGELDTKYCDIAVDVQNAYKGATQLLVPGVGHSVHIENVDAFCDILITEKS